MGRVIANIFWTALFWIGLFICVLIGRNAFADPCDPPTGWTGEIVADVGDQQILVTDDNLYFAAYNPQEYIFSFLPDAHRITVPFDSVIVATYDIATCTYYAEYDDVVFNNGFED